MLKKAHSFLLIAVLLAAAVLTACSGSTDMASGENGSKKP